jgi:hypothetical protein
MTGKMNDFDYRHGRCQADRLAAPQSWVRTEWGTPPVQMTWHHVIPYSVLRDCWNALANHQRTNSKARVSLQIYMRLLGFEHASAKALIKAMADGALGSGAQERIETAVAYPPWDIVEGPRNRVDDPGDDFDEYSAGLSATEQSRHEKLHSLFNGLKILNRATEGVGELDDRMFVKVANDMFVVERNLQNAKQFIKFRESMWRMIEPPGRIPLIPAAAAWRKKRSLKPGTFVGSD